MTMFSTFPLGPSAAQSCELLFFSVSLPSFTWTRYHLGKEAWLLNHRKQMTIARWEFISPPVCRGKEKRGRKENGWALVNLKG